MTASCYDAALARLLVYEGGYTNHPADPGGPAHKCRSLLAPDELNSD